MKNETYNFEIRTMIAQFIDAYNDVIIRRYNDAQEIQDKIHVNFVYAPKSRVLHDIVNKAQHITLPVIAVSLNSVTRNVNRVFNKHEGPLYNPQVGGSSFSRPKQPVPVDLSISMSIITKFQSDMDQILTNFIPYNDGYTVISWPAPYTELELRNAIKWGGSVQLNYPKDITHQQQYRCLADTSFTIEGYVFKFAEEFNGMIYNVDTSFTALSSLYSKYDTLLGMENEYNTDEIYIKGRPQVKNISPYIAVPCVSGTEYTIEGKMFEQTTGIYLSSTEGVYNSSVELYPNIENPLVSADYPPFSGIVIDNWTMISDSLLKFILPSPVSAGYIDLIVANEAGYGVLTVDSVRETLNPYPSGSYEYNNYVEYQVPAVSGIQVPPFYGNCE